MPTLQHNDSADNLVISKHRLSGSDVSFSPSPNTSGPFKDSFPDTIVIHFTAGSSLSSSVNVMTNPNNKVSAHLAVGRQGEIVQMLPFNKIGWHAGKSSWQGRTSLNQYSLGIELDNAGELTPNGEGFYTSWFGGVYESNDVFKGTHRNQTAPRYWHRYTEAQIMRTFSLCQLLCRQYGITCIVGHEELAPDRKVDPGPAFPLDKLRSRMLGDAEPSHVDVTESNTQINTFDVPQPAVVRASKLNVRSGPGTHYEKQGLPLLAGDKVEIIEVKKGWAKVERTTTGWVSEQYLATVKAE